jgi:hypothetical protein
VRDDAPLGAFQTELLTMTYGDGDDVGAGVINCSSQLRLAGASHGPTPPIGKKPDPQLLGRARAVPGPPAMFQDKRAELAVLAAPLLPVSSPDLSPSLPPSLNSFQPSPSASLRVVWFAHHAWYYRTTHGLKIEGVTYCERLRQQCQQCRLA